ncbi:MAG: YitT family protein [Oscillospiraceae bacterium]|nr:YitT family protein [Oscillospiraceae bacterium]
MKKRAWNLFLDVLIIALGSAIYALGFDLFFSPNGLNAGGVTGLAMVFKKLTGLGSIGVLAIIMNVPLFLLGLKRLGGKFFFGSLLGMMVSNLAIDALPMVLPPAQVEPLLAALYGGVLSGLGLGLVFIRGASTGGSDIAVRLLQLRHRSFSMGKVMLMFDLVTVILTGLAYRDLNNALYSAVALYVNSIVLDAVIYGLDYSKVALIISDKYAEIVQAIDEKLDRGATLLHGQGTYTGQEKQVILVAIKQKQLAELKEAVSEIDRDAFVIVQNAHQVQGEGFGRYSKEEM